MKKTLVMSLAIALMVVFAFSGCAAAPATSQEPAQTSVQATEPPAKKLVFGYLAWQLSDVWNQYEMEAFKWCAAKLGVEVKVLDAQNDPAAQVTQAQELIDAKVDAIAVFPCTPEAAATIVRMSNEAGIPIANSNIFLPEDASAGKVVGQVGCLYRDIGYAAIKFAAENYPGCKLLYVHGAPGIGVFEDYKVGVDKALEEFKDKVTMVGLINGEWATEPSQNVTQDFITSGKSEFDVVFANNGQIAKGVYNALKDNNMTNIPIISTGGSQDDYQMMKDGIETANMTAPVNIQGAILFKYLWQNLNGVEIKETKIPLPIIPIDKDGMDKWIAWDNFQAAYDYIGGIEP